VGWAELGWVQKNFGLDWFKKSEPCQILVTTVSRAKAAEPIVMPFGILTRVG